MHYIINGEDQGAFTKKLPYKEASLYPVVDVYGTTKQVRIVQLYDGKWYLISLYQPAFVNCTSVNALFIQNEKSSNSIFLCFLLINF